MKIKNCATCIYSERDLNSLLLYCKGIPNHPLKIENSYQDAKLCYSYTYAGDKEKTIQTQLKLI